MIPAYNEEQNIISTIRDLNKYCPEYDKVIINDASTDTTKSILVNENVNYIDLPLNLGIGGCVQTGYMYANEMNYDVAVQMDGDGQHCASEIKKIVAPLLDANENIDAVIGSRFLTKLGFQSSRLRRMGIRFLSGLIYLVTKQKVVDVTSGFRAVNKKMIQVFAREYAQDYPEPEAIVAIAKRGGVIKEVPVIMREREYGKSSITALKSLYYMLKVSVAIIIQHIT